ncbi:MAG: ATP-binding protein [Gallionella sp.]
MSTSKLTKRIVIIAGPNGAGKTTLPQGQTQYCSL